MKKKKYRIGGMTCSSCSSHVQQAVNNIEGINAKVSLLTNMMEVTSENEINDEIIIEAVNKAGYKAWKIDNNELLKKQQNNIKRKKTILIISLVLLLLLMYISMGSMIGMNLPFFLKGKFIILNLCIQFTIAIVIMVIYRNYFIVGFKRLIKLSPNMDSLVAIGSLASFVYAIVNSLIIIYNYNKNFDYANHLMHDLYFDSTVMILVFVSIGRYIEELSKNKTTKALDLLMDLVPKSVLKFDDNISVNYPIDKINVGDVIEIKPFDVVPLDGIIIKGSTSIDESSLTGESIGSSKETGDKVWSGTKNQEGTIFVRVLKTVEDSTMSEIIKMVENASTSKMKIEKIVDKVSLYFVPISLLIALITFIIWLIVDKSFIFPFKMSISVLLISCPCALGLATPLCVMVGMMKASKNHILIKDAEVFERLSKVNCLMFDKTGTITTGKMKVKENNIDIKMLNLLLSLENESNHPIAKSILKNYPQKELYKVDDFQSYPGLGISGIINGKTYYAGNNRFLKKYYINYFDNEPFKAKIFLFDQSIIYGYILLEDSLKENSIQTIQLFKNIGFENYLLTGDNEMNAKSIAKDLPIDKIYTQLFPQDKANIVMEYEKGQRHILMVGDGINDSVALQCATVSIAMNETNIARTSADIVLTNNDILNVYNVYALSKKVVKNIKINLLWALLYNIIAIPIAAGVLYYPLGLKLNPMIASLCMSLSSICVCLNALRINNVKFYKGEEKMKIFVKDMMCQKCVGHIKESLSVPNITSINIDLETKEVVLETSLSKEAIFELIKNAGYTPTDK